MAPGSPCPSLDTWRALLWAQCRAEGQDPSHNQKRVQHRERQTGTGSLQCLPCEGSAGRRGGFPEEAGPGRRRAWYQVVQKESWPGPPPTARTVPLRTTFRSPGRTPGTTEEARWEGTRSQRCPAHGSARGPAANPGHAIPGRQEPQSRVAQRPQRGPPGRARLEAVMPSPAHAAPGRGRAAPACRSRQADTTSQPRGAASGWAATLCARASLDGLLPVGPPKCLSHQRALTGAAEAKPAWRPWAKATTSQDPATQHARRSGHTQHQDRSVTQATSGARLESQAALREDGRLPCIRGRCGVTCAEYSLIQPKPQFLR